VTAPGGGAPIGVTFTEKGADPVIGAVRELAAQIKQLRTVQDDTRRSGELLTKAQAGLRDVLVRLAQLLAVQRLAAFTKDTIDATAEIGRLADRTGITVETLSALGQVADDNGQSLQDLGNMFKVLSRSVTELESGSPDAVRAFAAIGLTAKDLAGLSLDQRIERIAAAFAKLPDPTKATAASLKIFGKSGDETINILKQINAVGLEGLRNQAREIGALVTEEQVRQAKEFNKSLNDLKDALQGIVRITAGGLLPGVSQEINDIASAVGQLSDANKRLLGVGTGVLAAALFGGVVGGPIGAGVGAAIAAVLLLIAKNASAAADEFERLSKADPVFLQASLDAKRAELAAAQAELEAAKRQAVGARGDRGDFLPRGFTALAGRVEKLQAEVGVLEKALAARQQAGAAAPAGTAGPTQVAPELLAARFAAIKAAADRELAYFKLIAQGKVAADQAAFDQGLISLRQFFTDRRATIAEETQKEIAALRAERAGLVSQQAQTVAGTPEAIKAASQIADVDEKVREARERGRQELAAADAEELQRVRQIGQERLGFEQKVLEAKGQTVAAAIIGAEQEVRAFRDLLNQEGITGAEQDAQAAGLEQLLVTRVQLTDLQDQASRALAEIDRQRQAITNEVTVGTLTEVQGQQQIAALEASRLPQLRAIAAAALAAAEALGDPAAIANAQQLNQQLDDLATSANLAAQRTAQLTEGLIQAGESDLGNFFANVATNVSNLGDVFRQFFQSVLADLARLEGQFLESSIFRAILGAGGAAILGAGAGGIFGVDSGGGAGVFFGALGGPVPGTGMGDIVPAMLSPGEHVLTRSDAKTLARAGLLPIPGRSVLWNLRQFTVPRFFAAGGPVGGVAPLPAPSAAARATIDGLIHVTHDEGLIIRVMRGAFLRIAGENRRELRDLTEGSGF
jgi:hypothetical protein